ncbi:CAMK protein kinase [Saprolegnia parasitica CBS 223.65]|uniref:CAMK protein kinase n=1 Tax=Saprolegnia parasitica (strain CBS 223.65) TaxID=695850 RepID=A0A067BRR9_SAPPC|nr:CAMK protein kinase [Saprolegnia parasitica CBS 223.65]KDO19500.1 CAMK protein kinase [Saprolegnia parasitica CBS 223.65]|eukprot:XP_012209803.1 CAMK protein kinase [Saprolegnia parasitica CBS 223.65]
MQRPLFFIVFTIHVVVTLPFNSTTTLLRLLPRSTSTAAASFVALPPWLALQLGPSLRAPPPPVLLNAFRWPPLDDLYALDTSRRLGHGSSSDLYLATHKSSRTSVAVKRFHRVPIANQAYQRKDLRCEVAALRALRGERHIVQILDHYTTENDDEMDVVLELVPGGTLADLLCTHGRLTEPVVRSLLDQLMDAVAACHDRDIVHRDIKPDNILLTDADPTRAVLKLGDFGFATSGRHGLTRRCGSAGYMAPEMEAGAVYGQGIDVWSVGVVAYNLLTGCMPAFDASPRRRVVLPPNAVLSPCAQDFLNTILEPNPSFRPTIVALKQHPWLQSAAPLPTTTTTTTSLAGFLAQCGAMARDPTVAKRVRSVVRALEACEVTPAVDLDRLVAAVVAALDDVTTDLPLLGGQVEAYRASLRQLDVCCR